MKTFNANFILLASGRSVSGLGSAVFSFGMGLYVLDLTGSAAIFSLIFSMSVLPGILVNFFGGALIDKSDKKLLMVVSDILSGFSVLAFLVIFKFYPRSIAVFIAYSIVLSLIQAVFSLTISSSVPNFTNAENIAKVNSTLQAVSAAISIVGPIVGAVAYRAAGLEILFLLYGVSLILAGISEIFLVYVSTSAEPASKAGKKSSYIEDIRVTFRYLGQNRILAFFFIFAAVVNFIYNPLMFIVLPYVNYNQIRVSGYQLSLIQASGAIGVILSALVISMKKALHKALLKRFFTLFTAQALLIILWMFPAIPLFKSGSKWSVTIVFCIILILYGAMNTSQNIPMVTYFQLKIPDELRARVIGVFSSALYISSPFGIWIYGILLEKIPWMYVTCMSGVLMLLIGTFASRNSRYREFLRQQDEKKEEQPVEIEAYS